MKKDESCYISFFNDLGNKHVPLLQYQLTGVPEDAERRLRFHSRGGNSERVGDRVALAEVDASDLRGAHVHAQMEKFVSTDIARSLNTSKSNVETINVQIPVFVHKDAFADHEDDDHVTLKQIEDSGVDMWLSTTALRRSDLRVNTSRSHDYEWLCCGSLKKSRIARVMPFAGGVLYEKPGKDEVRSEQGERCWVWDWMKSKYVLDTARQRQREALNMEHSETEEDDETDDDVEEPIDQSLVRKRKADAQQPEIGHDDKRTKV